MFKKIGVFMILAMGVLLCGGCSSADLKDGMDQLVNAAARDNLHADTRMEENKSIYREDEDDSLADLYVTIVKGKKKSGNLLYTMADLNNYRYSGDKSNEDKPTLQVIVQEGTPAGPKSGYFGFGCTTANAVLEPRGHSSSEAPQKSLQIKLSKNAGLWRGQSTLNLNKHPFDLTRIRNKLSMDYFEELPDITSLRTQFVRLHVRDLSGEVPETGFTDFGLFTHVEQPNKTMLKAHHLNPDAQMYKAMNFEFFRYEDELKNTDDPGYSKKAFERILKIQGEEDHSKLLAMLEDVNNIDLDFNQVFDRHFDRENYLTWLGTNILMGNIDTTTQNFILYSPVSSATWYFMPWDYDGAWGFGSQPRSKKMYAPWQTGLSNYWGCMLHKRFFKDPDNVKALSDKIEELAKTINRSKTTELLNRYYNIAAAFVKRDPDTKFLPGSIGEFESEYRRIADETERNRLNYYKNLEKPLPVYLGEAAGESGKLVFHWEPSYDFQGNDITYTFQISTTPDFSSLIADIKGLRDPECRIVRPEKGEYFWRVTVRDEKGNEQIAFDTYVDDKNIKHFGTKKLVLN